MSEPFIGQIQIFPYNFAPRGWAFCQGQQMSIAQNTALFSLLGTTFGGNGQTTFGLPDFRGRMPVGVGNGPGLPSIDLGQIAGTPTVTLTIQQMPIHQHSISLLCNGSEGGTNSPAGGYLGKADPGPYAPTNDNSQMGPQPASGPAGGNQPFGIMPPYLGINFCIALEGIFPSRN